MENNIFDINIAVTKHQITILPYVENYIEDNEKLRYIVENKIDSKKFKLAETVSDSANIKHTKVGNFYAYGKIFYEEEYQYQNSFSVYEDKVTLIIYFDNQEKCKLKNVMFIVYAHYDENNKVDGLLIKELFAKRVY